MTLTIRYQEPIRTHARRLQVSPYFVYLRRRILAARLRDLRLPCYTPAYLVDAAAEALLRTLSVRQGRASGTDFVFLIPIAVTPTDDLLYGQRTYLRSLPLHHRTAHPSSATLPYGYFLAEDGHIHPDPVAGPAIRCAFALMLELGAADPHVPWQSVAERLNAAGHCTQSGRPWQAGDVRDLIRIPAYAGYVRSGGRGASVERLPHLSEPLIDLEDFLLAARLKRKPAPPWLTALARKAAGP